MNIVVSTPLASEPVSNTTAKLWCKVTSSADDDLFTLLISAAREAAELYTRRAFITQTITATFDGFPNTGQFVLPRPPLLTVTSVTSYDEDNTSSVFSSAAYTVDTAATPGRIFLNDGYDWPDDLREYSAVTVVYTAGYGATAASVPAAIRTAILETVATWYVNRTTAVVGNAVFELPEHARVSLAPYRVFEV